MHSFAKNLLYYMIDSGLLNINKPSGITSFSIVQDIRKILGIKKVGHCGTLDPLAEGILLILFGKATKHQSLFMNLRKTYRTKLLLGITTDTGDITGNIIKKSNIPDINIDELNTVLKEFTGEIEQIPPMYSAIKHHGKKLYELARKGFCIDRKPRKITIYSIEILSFENNVIELRIECSKGTYIRTLGEDIGNRLNCGATVIYLCREKITPFNLDNSINAKSLRDYSCYDLYSKSYNIEEIQKFL